MEYEWLNNDYPPVNAYQKSGNAMNVDCFPNGKPWVVHIYVNLP